jgi:uncharacterized surface protein with fasciclin (FAS1) repeats
LQDNKLKLLSYKLQVFLSYTSFNRKRKRKREKEKKKKRMLDTLYAILSSTNIANELTVDGPYTIFAPTDNAFNNLPTGLMNCLLENEKNNGDALKKLLYYHVINGQFSTTDLRIMDGINVPTLLLLEDTATTEEEGAGKKEKITINISDIYGLMINESAKILTSDVPTSNGYIHIIDTVLLPESFNVDTFLETSCNGDVEQPATATEDESSSSSFSSLSTLSYDSFLGLTVMIGVSTLL